MVLVAWYPRDAALHECALSQVSKTHPPLPTGLSYNREVQLHTSLDHYLLVVLPLLQICSLYCESGTNHLPYIHTQVSNHPDMTLDSARM